MTEMSPAEELFFAALALPPADRAAYLDAACTDPALRARVEKLLAAHPRAAGFLEPPAPDATGPFAPADPDPTADYPGRGEQVGAVVGGKYKLLEAIGEGGMGTVFMAQQTEPVKRLVAVKVIKAGMDSKAVLARFEAERQALAMMDHPNIARVLDAGTTESGRPYFVMELVKGVPITQFCDARKLTPRQRLELFVPVCQAVQHAHQKGVIHRDLKPSNVLVTLYDDHPVPKVIDFGVAKAAGQPLTEHTLVTGFGAVVGTPEYMSPEQASFNQLDVDTRSDVYALGVLLYELLTGTTPVDRKSLGKAALLEVLRVVREVEPPRPSLKLSTADALPSIAANRGTEPARLSRLLRGELDWLVMKALEKDRRRRYDTAAGFAADVGRYLSGEPVQAVPPSAGYRLRTFVRRNRAAVAATTAVLLAVLTGAGVSTWQAVRATAAERDAVAAAREANDERRAAEVARAAEAEARHEIGQRYWGAVIDMQGKGVLALAETRRQIPPEFKELREYVALHVLAVCQGEYPLLEDDAPLWVEIRQPAPPGPPRPETADQAPGQYELESGGVVRELRTGRRLAPSPGRHYHPEATRFAVNGRLLLDGSALIDLCVEKTVGYSGPDNGLDSARLLKSGAVWAEGFSIDTFQRWGVVLPAVHDLPDDETLLLWAKVRSRGERNRDGKFVPWDEAAWERHRQELVRVAKPMGAVPFPGKLIGPPAVAPPPRQVKR